MVLGHSRKGSTNSPRTSTDGGETVEDETVVSSEEGNILTHIISQLRPGADLSRVTLPTFVLEPRSMLERITNFMAHPDTLLPMPDIEDPIQRFIAVTKFYLSGWHIKPPGVKKPLNPILGETFTGYWDYSDGTRGYYISEQTSHHPPKSSYFFMAPEHHIRIDGTLKPRSKFLGNSVGSFMEGIAVMRFLNRHERYFVTQPNMYARGILFGKMKYELGDHALVRCPELGLEADIEFKVKGWVAGTYNAIGGFIKETATGKNLYELSGLWHGEMFIKDLATGKKDLLFDATNAKASYPKARPVNQQTPRESQRLWESTVKAIKKADHRVATDEKTRIEDEQRREAAERGENAWTPKLFKKAPPGDEEKLDWVLDAEVDPNASPDVQIKQILAIAPILPEQAASADFQQAKALPSEQGKPLPIHDKKPAAAVPPPSQQQQQKPEEDLIDFGQHDESQPQAKQPGAQQPGTLTSNAAPSSAPLSKTQTNASEKLKSSRQDKVVRLDSTSGHEDTFIDAES